jgi:hypothetical protein
VVTESVGLSFAKYEYILVKVLHTDTFAWGNEIRL